MLQVFHLGVVKVDLDIVYMQVFKCFHTYVASVSSRLHMFARLHTCVFQVFSDIFASVLDVFTSVSAILNICYQHYFV